MILKRDLVVKLVDGRSVIYPVSLFPELRKVPVGARKKPTIGGIDMIDRFSFKGRPEVYQIDETLHLNKI
ncbi:MAG: hypothetical protein L6Q54_12480 [Leptospiraceae bacterium]|nr:hypothetical protein [Leptospiraceae bacterium]MCK6382049.1 hypothetical protein [Leptospiraceae bacterium]